MYRYLSSALAIHLLTGSPKHEPATIAHEDPVRDYAHSGHCNLIARETLLCFPHSLAAS